MAAVNDPLSSLRAAMEILPDGVLIVDRAQTIVACNRLAETLFGYRHGELTGQPLGVLVPAAKRAAHAKLVAGYHPAAGERRMEDRPILFGISKSGLRLPVSIGISTSGTGEDRLFIAVVRDARSLDDTLEGAALLAETDPLTGLGNRRFLDARFEELDADPERPVALLFLDLDRFKLVNDQHGHEAGDELLRILARRLDNSLRAGDLCARLGGDEFVVLPAGVTDPAQLEAVAFKLHAGLSAPVRLGDAVVRVGVSIGGAIGCPRKDGAAALLAQADAAMYRAKKAGDPFRLHRPRGAVAA